MNIPTSTLSQYELDPTSGMAIIAVLAAVVVFMAINLLIAREERDRWRENYHDLVRRTIFARQPPPAPPPPTRAQRRAVKLANLAARSDNPHERALADQLARRQRAKS